MDMLAMVLVGGRGKRLKSMTDSTAKPAVPFLGKYKLIDFVLSNVSHSGIETVGILTQYEPQELMRYIGRGAAWDLDAYEGGIQFLTPFSNKEGEQFQKGTADAIRQHRGFITHYDPEYVLILSGDHVYKMNYNALLDEAKKSDADMVIGAFHPADQLSRYGILETDGTLLTGFEEKPESPRTFLASMGIYLFKKDVLLNLLTAPGLDDFGTDIIPTALKNKLNTRVYTFDGYFRDVGTISALYDANMELLDRPELIDLYDFKNHPVYSGSENLPPHHTAAMGQVTDSFISDGTLCLGRLTHSIVAHGCLIKDGAHIKDSILHPYVSIGEYAKIENAILLEGTVVLPDTSLIFDVPTLVDNAYIWELGSADE